MLYGNMVKRVCTVGWALVGLIVAAMVAQGHADAAALGDPENAFGFACRLLLGPGALGLMIASILAANMSTCSAFLVDSGALFTEGLYRRHVAAGPAGLATISGSAGSAASPSRCSASSTRCISSRACSTRSC